jgi:hypothetical protein
MKFQAPGIEVDAADLADILAGNGDYTSDASFMQQASVIARHSIGIHSDQLKKRLPEVDERFAASSKGLLEKLGRLDEASNEELGKLLSFLAGEPKTAADFEYNEAGYFSRDHIPALIAFVEEKLAMLDLAKGPELAAYNIAEDSGAIRAAEMRHDLIEADEKKYKKYLEKLKELNESSGIPGED